MVIPPSLLARAAPSGGGGGGGLLSPVMPGRSSNSGGAANNFAFSGGAANYALLSNANHDSGVVMSPSTSSSNLGLRSSNSGSNLSRLVDQGGGFHQQLQHNQGINQGINHHHHQQQQQQMHLQNFQQHENIQDGQLLQQMQQQQQIPPPQDVKMEQHIVKMETEQGQNNLLIPPKAVEVKMEVKTEDELQHQQHSQQMMQNQQMIQNHQAQLQRQEMMRLQQAQQQQAHLSLLHQQRMLKHQQQQLMQSIPPQHTLQRQPQVHMQQQISPSHNHQLQQIQQQQQQQLNPPNNMSLPPKQPPAMHMYEAGSCYRRVMQYIYQQKLRPNDNNIAFWRRFVAEYFAPRAKKRWCVSLYGSGNDGRQPTGVFPQDVWQCEICGTKPGRGFETTVEVLPRLCKIKYDSGINEELLFVDMPQEIRLNSGLIVLQCGKAIQESIFDQLRVVRDGQLRIIFSPELKILSWEFCARSHEELLYRRTIVPQVNQLANVAQKYHQSSVQAGTAGLSQQDLLNNCNMFVSSSRSLARNLEVPTVNDLGYTKRYVRCLQISEVVNSMKDLIDFSHENKKGPIQSLIAFPRRGVQQQQQEQHQFLSSQTHVQEQPEQLTASLNLPAITIPSTKHQLLSNGLHGSLSSPNLLGSFPSLQQSSGYSSLPGSALPSPSSMNHRPQLSGNINMLQPSSFHNPGLQASQQMNLQASQQMNLQASQQMNLQASQQMNLQASQQMNLQASQQMNLQASQQMNSLQSPTHSNNNSGILNSPPLQQNQTGQQQQQDTQSVVHHLLQEMMMNSGNGGGSGMGTGLGMPNNVVHGNSSVFADMRSSMDNGRLNMVGSSQIQQQQQPSNMYLQDSSLHGLAGNGILSSLNGFEMPFDWKSP